MRVARIGFTVLKGGRHVARPETLLDLGGPVGDRAYCLLDPARDRVLRTVENPTMVQVIAGLDDGQLRLELPAGTVVGVPEPTGEVRDVDYWGRREEVEVVGGPWAALLSEHVGHPVLLARPARPGAVVYGGSVSLVTTSSMARLQRELGGGPLGSERFRATVLVDTGGLPAHVEDGWVGRELRLGEARVRVRGVVPRCVVVDVDPASGARTAPVLRTLAGYRRGDSEICFGVDADVIVAGRVRVGDRAVLERD